MEGHKITKSRGVLLTKTWIDGIKDREIVVLHPDSDETSAYFRDSDGRCFLWSEGEKNSKKLCTYKVEEYLEIEAELLPVHHKDWPQNIRKSKEVAKCSS